MSEAANYSTFEQLRNGRRVEIRALSERGPDFDVSAGVMSSCLCRPP